jgi:hypothetical protein
VTVEVVIYEAFVEGKLEAPKHLARTMRVEPKSCGGSARKMTRPADPKSAGQPAVQILYERSPECSKTPQNAVLQPLSHNNIRKNWVDS